MPGSSCFVAASIEMGTGAISCSIRFSWLSLPPLWARPAASMRNSPRSTGYPFAAETGHQWVVPEALRVNGRLFALRDPDDPAVEDGFHHGIEVAREQGALFWELRLALSLAHLRGSPRVARVKQARACSHRFTIGSPKASGTGICGLPAHDR